MSPDEVRAMRIELGLSQAALARALGVYWLTISKWETGAQQPPPYLALALKYLAVRALEQTPV